MSRFLLGALVLLSTPAFAVLVGAHQGGVFGPEGPNSLPQFQQAFEWGANIVEMDLRVTKDGVAVVFHDEELSPLSSCRGRINDKTWEDVSQCHFAGREATISRFEDILDWAAGKDVTVNAEFKDEGAIAPAIAAAVGSGALGQVYFQTQNNRTKYEMARAMNANVRLLYRVENDEDMAWIKSLNDNALAIIEIHKKMARRETVDAIHAMGKLASMDSFDFSLTKELFRASCNEVFELGIDIAITNSTRSCLRQRP